MPIEIKPALLAAVVEYKGRSVLIEDDVMDIARQLRDIHPQLVLKLRAEADPAYFVVEQHIPQPDGSVDEQLVLTSHDLGSHIVDRARIVTSEGYDLHAEVEALEAKRTREQDHAFEEKLGEHGERIAHAVRKDTHQQKNF